MRETQLHELRESIMNQNGQKKAIVREMTKKAHVLQHEELSAKKDAHKHASLSSACVDAPFHSPFYSPVASGSAIPQNKSGRTTSHDLSPK